LGGDIKFGRIVLSVVSIARDEMTLSESVQANFEYSSIAVGC
jgi:hypothetical protein